MIIELALAFFEGVGLDVLAEEAVRRHKYAYQPLTGDVTTLDVGGEYQFRVRGERHLLNPRTIHSRTSISPSLQPTLATLPNVYAILLRDQHGDRKRSARA